MENKEFRNWILGVIAISLLLIFLYPDTLSLAMSGYRRMMAQISMAPGSLTSGSFNISDEGRVGIGVAQPGQPLEVAGQVKITGGNPGAGKVLTSDATGLASWQTSGGGGGMANPMTTQGDIIYGGAAGVPRRLAGSAGFLKSTGAAAPIWTALAAADMPSLDISNTTGILSAARGGTGVTAYAKGDVIFSDAVNSLAKLPIGAVNQVLTVGALGVPVWQAPTGGGLPVGTTNQILRYDGIKWISTNSVFVTPTGVVGIGVSNPVERLEVAGSIKTAGIIILGGNPGVGKVLTSDATGLATWETPADGSGLPGGELGYTMRHNGMNWVADDKLRISADGRITIKDLTGTGNAYACVAADGRLFRSASPCGGAPPPASAIIVSLATAAETTEGGGAASIRVKLGSQPSAGVFVTVFSNDTSEGVVSPSPTLAFTSANWNTEQTVTVTGVDDAVVDGDVSYSVAFGAAISDDSSYNGIIPEPVTLINKDNDNVAVTCGPGAPINDARDGKSYQTIKIGDQCWMAGNLNYGNFISRMANQMDNNGVPEKYCYNNSSSACDNYSTGALMGGLYTWNEAMGYPSLVTGARDICPAGWHIPSNTEWNVLENQLATNSCLAERVSWGCTPAGAELKSNGSSGFNAPLAGFLSGSGSTFSSLGVYAFFWTSTILNNNLLNNAAMRALSSNTDVYRNNFGVNYGMSVRCVKG